jgi:hypothetical protein
MTVFVLLLTTVSTTPVANHNWRRVLDIGGVPKIGIVDNGGKLSTSANDASCNLSPLSMTPAVPAFTTPATTTCNYREEGLGQTHRLPTLPPLLLRIGKAGKNNLNEELTPSSRLG